MARFCGKIGFSETIETRPGIWEEDIIEKTYYGDITRSSMRWTDGKSTNDNISISNTISIIADSYAYNNAHLMKYVEFMGTLWKIESIEVERPRLLLSLGGEYNA